MSANEWKDLLEGLTLLSREQMSGSPFHCEHDTLWVASDPTGFSQGEIEHLNDLGFFPDTEGGFMSFRFGSA